MDWGVVFKVAEAYGMDVTPYFIRMLRLFERTIIEEINKKTDAKQ